MPHGDYHAFSGARAKLFFNGTIEAGWATGIRGSENTMLQRVDVLGDVFSREIEVISQSVTMSADFVRIIGRSLQEMGIWPKGETKDIINFPEMTATVFDTISDTEQALYTITGIKCESRNFTVDRQGLMSVNATFQARRIFDESL